MVETFFDNLMAGNSRAIVILILGCLVLFIVLKYIGEIFKFLKPYLSVVLWVMVILLIYGWFVFPEKVTMVFFVIVDFIAGIIETNSIKN